MLLQSQMIWMGAQKEASFTSRTWRWVTGNVVDRPPWGREQPNNYNGEQNCVVVDGGRDWLWNDVGCNLDQIHWICKFRKSCFSAFLFLSFCVFVTIVINFLHQIVYVNSSTFLRSTGPEGQQHRRRKKFLDGRQGGISLPDR